MKSDDAARIISEHMAELGRKGGTARAARMTPAERRRSAVKASKAALESRRQAEAEETRKK